MRGVLRTLSWTLSAGLVLLAILILMIALPEAIRQELEPDSAAYNRCGGAIGGGGSPEVARCYERESAKSGLDVAFPWLKLAGACAMVSILLGVGAFLIRRRRLKS